MNSSLCFTLVVMLLVVHQTEATTSWDSYIDNLIVQSKDVTGTAHVDLACIIGKDGGAKWTTNAHANALKITTTEAANIARAFKSQDFTTFQSSGVNIAGVRYSFLREDDNVVQAKKAGSGAITMQASKTAVVIAHIIEGGQQNNGNKAVAVIAEYLESLNY